MLYRSKSYPLALAGAAFTFVFVLLTLSGTGRAQDAGSGQQLFEKRCGGCHAMDRDKEGPRLAGVYGRVSGSVESFTYSGALKGAHITWDSDSLDKWLSGPDKLVPENEMAFHVENAGERSAIIEYLKEVR